MKFYEQLRDWYGANARKLPWREDCSAYKTVVSEFMLQQTQVDTVLGYFMRWIEKFPSFEVLAEATETEVVKMWEGLGYYSRARNLHALAKQVTLNGSFPQTAEGWLQFKGIGDYTAAAIGSIAFGDPVPVVDGNVIRVLARVTATDCVFKGNTEAAKYFKPKAYELLDTKDPGTHNQAMMELGAKVCTRYKPLCLFCPVQKHCLSWQKENPENFPKFVPRKTEQRSIERILWIDSHSEKILLFCAHENAKRLSSIYELPEKHSVSFAPETSCEKILEKRRGISNESIREIIYRVKGLDNASTLNPQNTWIPLQSLDQVTLSGPHRRWLKELGVIRYS
ncbi:MAG: hypothetical protein A2007_02330 [Verrucomicrobia bacterium GWC2_42_7]|nr:MAG: hypothetical protein A2007_02330 [Verrucomicrobia bacterium GWC2_42_7]